MAHEAERAICVHACMCRVTGASQSELERALFRSKLMVVSICSAWYGMTLHNMSQQYFS